MPSNNKFFWAQPLVPTNVFCLFSKRYMLLYILLEKLNINNQPHYVSSTVFLVCFTVLAYRFTLAFVHNQDWEMPPNNSKKVDNGYISNHIKASFKASIICLYH